MQSQSDTTELNVGVPICKSCLQEAMCHSIQRRRSCFRVPKYQLITICQNAREDRFNKKLCFNRPIKAPKTKHEEEYSQLNFIETPSENQFSVQINPREGTPRQWGVSNLLFTSFSNNLLFSGIGLGVFRTRNRINFRSF